MCTSFATSSLAIRPAFDFLDADRDGRISRDDLNSSFCHDDGFAVAMIADADADRNGFVDFEEFERVLAAGGGARGGDSIMEEVFRMMDRDGDGRVGFGDLKEWLSMAGMGPLGDEEVRAMIRMSGGDESEGVGLEGLVKILAVDFER